MRRLVAVIILMFGIAQGFMCPGVLAQIQPTTPEKHEVRPLPQPADLSLLFETQDGRSDFRFDEMVNVKLGDASKTPGRYIHFQPADAWTIHCEPADKVIDRRKDTGRLSSWLMLYSGPGCGVGFGGVGIGGSCFDCTSDTPVTEKPTSWYPFALNYDLEFTSPGEYACTAQTGDVRLASSSRENPTVFQLSSAPLKLNVYRDDRWASAMLDRAVKDLQSEACSTCTPETGCACWDSSHVVRFLRTEESLRAAVRLFGGIETPYPQGQLWLAILQTPYRKLAVDLLHRRVLDSDFAVSESVVDTLVAMSIREESPSAFAPDANPADYHAQAINLLRNYIREIGLHLSEKSGVTRDVSMASYERYANEKYCDSEPLIPEREVKTTLAMAKQ